MKKMESLKKLKKLDPLLRFRVDRQLSIVRYLRGKLGQVPEKNVKGLKSAALRFIKGHPDLFGAVQEKDLAVLQDETDPYSGWSLILQQKHGQYCVYGGSIRFHMTKNGTIDTINNRLFPDLKKVPLKSRITPEQAIKAAQQRTKCEREPERKPELLVFRFQGRPYLAWEVRINDTKPGERGVPPLWIVFVDSATGKVLLNYDNFQTAGPVVGSGTGYYSWAGTVNAWFDDTTYQLHDTTRTGWPGGGPEIITNDEDGASPSEDSDNNWNDLSTSPRHDNQGAEVDAHRFASDVADYYYNVHSRNSFDGAGANFITTVHVGTNWNNGGWNGLQVNLGDGSGVAPGDDYECSDDWLAHEFTHAYTQHTCALMYWSESGALNESFSDSFAAFITGDWLVFEDTWLNVSAPAWRNMMDPTNGGQWDNSSEAAAQASVFAGHQPSHYNDRYTGTWDNAGVHINSGIINNLVYLLTVGGTHTVSGITVTGIGQSAVEQMIFRCMTDNLVGNPTATFLDFREAMLDVCQDLFPTDLVKLTQVKNAFNAVGIGPDIYVRDNLADTGAEPYPGGYLYASPDIINRQTLSANPATDFANMMDDTLWENVEYGQNNYIYVRLQNRGDQEGDATINVYFSSATTFSTPASWIHIGTLFETGILPGTVKIAGPLTFPSAMIPSLGHYCMIAVVSDPLDVAPDHSLITSVSDFLYFVRNTNNIAYRNMDVVDLVPGTPGKVEVEVGTLPHLRERYDLRININRFIPGAKIRIRGLGQALDGAIVRGLKLVKREKGQNHYEILVGRELARREVFRGFNKPQELVAYGFDNVLIEKNFRLIVEYILPKAEDMRRWARRWMYARYELVIQQLWNGHAVGAAGIILLPPKKYRRRIR